MKILIVSGFLGAGKTTFIKMLSDRTRKHFVVLENEYAGTGVDTKVLGDTGMKVWELTEGCVCCSTKKDFAESVLTIANTLDPEYLVVEPTGVAMLSNLLENLRRIEYERIRLLQPVLIVDPQHLNETLSEFPEIIMDQICFASSIVCSRTEYYSEEERLSVENFLRGMNPDADICTEHYSGLPAEWFLKLLSQDGSMNQFRKSIESTGAPDLETLTLKNISQIAPERMILFLEDLIRGKYGQIIRAKGYLPTGDSALRFDVAGSEYAVTGCELEKGQGGNLVFIGKKMETDRLYRLFPSKMAGRVKSINTEHTRCRRNYT